MKTKWNEIIRKVRFKDPIMVTEADIKASFVRIKQRIDNNEKVHLPVEKRIRFVASLSFKIAAAVALLVSLGIGGYNYYDKNQVITIANNSNDVKEIVLPDGSDVSLRAKSELQYRKNFLKRRDVHLTGEALFDVTKNAKRPFVVHTDLSDVQVLGTVFSVRAFSTENATKTILKEGSVRLTNNETESTVLLRPGEQADIAKGDAKITVRKVKNMDRALAWKTKTFSFENETLVEILTSISDAYNRELVLEIDRQATSRYTLKFNHGEQITKMLDVISEVGKFNYNIDSKQIVVTNK